ncbi:MAG: hypothetical protein ACKO3N_10215 [Verrucomicrobiota bacterium]
MFSNHYHFVAHSPVNSDSAESLATMLKTLHTKTAGWVNRLDKAPGRLVWFNYRDTLLTHPGSYFARLKYTHQNPVKHGLVSVASLYPWCSAAWFERTAAPAQVRTVYRLRVDRVAVPDEFEPDTEWSAG